VSNGAAAGAGSGLPDCGSAPRGGVAAFDLNPRPSAARLAASARTLRRVDFHTIPSPLWRCPWRSGLSAVTHPVLQARVNQLICSVRKVLRSLLLSGATGLQPPEYHSPARSADDHYRCSAEDALVSAANFSGSGSSEGTLRELSRARLMPRRTALKSPLDGSRGTGRLQFPTPGLISPGRRRGSSRVPNFQGPIKQRLGHLSPSLNRLPERASALIA
jgi:hypothetical protein